MSNTSLNKPFCPLCGRSAQYKTLSHRNDDLHENIRFHSKCIKEKVEREGDPTDTLRILNIPLNQKVWDDVSRGEELSEAITKYTKAMGPRQVNDRFIDSNFTNTSNSVVENFNVTEEILAKWGGGYSKEEYLILHERYKDYCAIRQPTTKTEDDRYVQTAKLSLVYDHAINEANAGDIDKLQKSLTNSLKELGLDVKTITDTDERLSLGERIREWENEAPTPVIDDAFEDVDKIEKYFDRFFLTPLKRNFDRASEEEIEAQNRMYKDDIPGFDLGGDDDEQDEESED